MATFGLRYFAQLRSKYKGVFWRVEIAERDYSGPSEGMEFSGGVDRTYPKFCGLLDPNVE